MSGFKKFLLRGNVVDLAVAVVIGAAFGAVVQALVKSLITPLIGAFGGVPDFSELAFTVNGSRFAIGEFINALLSFVILAAVVYFFVVLPVNKLMDRFKSDEPVGPRTRECPHCLSKIPVAATLLRLLYPRRPDGGPRSRAGALRRTDARSGREGVPRTAHGEQEVVGSPMEAGRRHPSRSSGSPTDALTKSRRT